MNLSVSVNTVVADVEELDDLGLGELFDDTFTACKFFLKLAWVLYTQKRGVNALIFNVNRP